MRRARGTVFAVAALAVLAAGPAFAAGQSLPPAPVAASPPSAAQSPTLVALKARLADRHFDATPEERLAAVSFYEARGGDPVFAGPQGVTPRGQALLAALKSADEYGLPAAELVPSKLAADATALDADQLAETEARLALAGLKYARFARGGRIPEPSTQLATYLDRAPQYAEPRSVLDALGTAADAGVALKGFNPQSRAFEALRKAYNEQRLAAAPAAEDGDELPEVKLKAGMTHPAVAIVRKLLKVAPPPGADGKPSNPEFFDIALNEAVVIFQSKNGLEPADGIVGAKTRAALASFKRPALKTLLANMEAWRWMPADPGRFHVSVNIPEFTVRVVENGAIIHTERVVTGLVDHQTPVFSDMMQTVVLQPDWVLPESIKVNEALPSLLGGGGMFYSSGLRIKKGERDVDPGAVNWGSANLKAYTFYQPPGESNALGQVKFLFPNKHAVYMHDTPAKHLFDSAVRAYSHGCMRVRNPVKLAEIILMHDKGWPAEKVQALLDDGPEDNRIALDTPVPVHVTYFTAVAQDDGSIKTYPDVYGHEQRITLALEGRWGEIDVPPDHLAPIEDREFEVKSAAFERRRAADERSEVQGKQSGGSEVEKALKGIFGGF